MSDVITADDAAKNSGSKEKAAAKNGGDKRRHRPLQAPSRRRARAPQELARDVETYSRFVGITKWLLPTAATALILAVVAWPYLDIDEAKKRLLPSNLRVVQNQESNLLNARYVGKDAKERSYTVTADIVRSLEGRFNRMQLEVPKADVSLKDGSWMVLTANSGVYSRVKDELDLQGDVVLFHDGGYEVRTSKAQVDLKAGIAKGKEPVAAQGSFGELKAQGFRIEDQGNIIHLTGKSRVVLYPKNGKPINTATTKSDKPNKP